MDITPQDVIDALIAGGVKDWVLMGLHGYVGYMPDPRATQDVDVMVGYNSRARAKKAILMRWPTLVVRELSQVTRFADPADLDASGQPKQVVDLMHPYSPFQDLILKEYVFVDEKTQHRLPTLEAALASKYAAIISPYRDREKKNTTQVTSVGSSKPTAIASARTIYVVLRGSCGRTAPTTSFALSSWL